MKNRWMWLAAAGTLVSAACGNTANDSGLVARVGPHTFTVDQAVKLLADRDNIPGRTDVVKAVADLWVDYTLLAEDVAKDSTLRDMNLEPLVRQLLDRQMVSELRDSVIQVDTAVSDPELKTLYEQQAPGARITASHILFSFPDQATPAQRDSVRRLADSVRERAVAGEDFAALAREYSRDRGTAARGGDLGTFGRGTLPPALDKVAFALQPGQVSGVVESPFGLHIIRVVSKTVPEFELRRDSFRIQVQSQRYAEAESVYVAGLEARAHPKVADEAAALIKGVARDPGMSLSRRAARRPLVSYLGGAVTVGEFQLMLQSRPDREQFAQSAQRATDEQIRAFLRGLTQRDLLVAEAEKGGLGPSQARVDSLVDNLRGQLLQLAGKMGLRKLDRAPGEALAPAVDRAVQQSLRDIVTGARNVVPLGQVSFQLRAHASPSIFDPGVRQVVAAITRIRGARRQPGQDTIGRGPRTPDAAGSPEAGAVEGRTKPPAKSDGG